MRKCSLELWEELCPNATYRGMAALIEQPRNTAWNLTLPAFLYVLLGFLPLAHHSSI